MAAADLTTATATRGSRRTAWRTFAGVLGGLWLLTLLAAGLGELPNHIRPSLRLEPHAVPSVADAAGTWLHNVRAAGWPLLFAALHLYRQRWQRRLGDLLLAVAVLANTTLVGAAIAAGHERLLPYLPHLPLEWAALALSATAWLLASRHQLPRKHLAALAAVFALLLALAALIETYAVPHL